MPQRTWSYRGFSIESNPGGQTFKYVVWLQKDWVVATCSLWEMEQALDFYAGVWN